MLGKISTQYTRQGNQILKRKKKFETSFSNMSIYYAILKI